MDAGTRLGETKSEARLARWPLTTLPVQDQLSLEPLWPHPGPCGFKKDQLTSPVSGP